MLSGGYSDLWKAIIRPPRDDYTISDLGPSEFKLSGIRVKRTDFEIKNKANLALKCSHFEPVKRPCKELPCVVYLHGNSSSRVESTNCLKVLIPQNITLFSFDFAGCGLSEGEYISLGWYEREDVETIINYLRNSGTVSTIGLWGRSMGAVTALMHADRDPSIAGIVLDSAFSSLRQLAEDLCKKHTKIPKFVMSGALAMIKSTIQSKAKFDINDLNPLKNHVAKAFIPALFVSGNQDEFIDSSHTKALHKAYAGEKNLILVDGDHNSERPKFMLDSVGIFFFNTLQVEHLIPKNQSVQDADDLQNFSEFDVSGTRKIGNQEKVQAALGEFEDEEDDEAFNEQMRIAIEQSQQSQLQSDASTQQQKEQKHVGDIFDLLNLDSVPAATTTQTQQQQQLPQQTAQKQTQSQKQQSSQSQEEIDWFGDSQEEPQTSNSNANPTQKSNTQSSSSTNNQPINPFAEFYEDYL